MACVLALALTAASCRGIHPAREMPMRVHVPQAFTSLEAAEAARQPMPDRWWLAFEDDQLDDLVERALADNFNLRKAWARLDAAQALQRVHGSQLRPQLDLDLAASKDHLMVSTGGTSQSTRTDRRSATAAASYEIDLWGRLRSLETAAQLDAQASRADLDAAAMTLAATVSDTYFSLIEQRAREQLIRKQVQVNETYLDLTRRRFGQGLASALDVYQQRQHAAATIADLPVAASNIQVLEHQLAVLLGQTPQTTVGGTRADLPDLPPPPEAGIPADLLKRRPDVRAAEMRAAAADRRIAAAIADRFPAVRLSASTPFQAQQTSELFRRFVWSIGASLSVPITDGGRRTAEVDRNRALTEEQINNYASVLLTALREVEDALVQERQQQLFLERLAEQVNLGRETLREARSRYANGLTDYLPVLTALQALHQLELRQLSERKRLLAFRVQLYRALGGSWMSELAPPTDSGETHE